MNRRTRRAVADPELIAQAADGIQSLLQRPPAYTAALLSQLSPAEIDHIARHAKHRGGAVAIAAIIYRARLRLASQEAAAHHEIIRKTVPYDPGCVARSPGKSAPGIRQVPAPDARP